MSSYRSQACKYCGIQIIWDISIKERRKWRESQSNTIHTFDRCKKIQDDKNKISVRNENLEPTDPKYDSLKPKIVENLRRLDVYERLVKWHIINGGEKDPSPQKIGLYLKLLVELEKNDSK